MKFGMIAGARNVVFFQYKMLVVGVKSNLGCEAGCRRFFFLIAGCIGSLGYWQSLAKRNQKSNTSGTASQKKVKCPFTMT